MIRLGLLVGVFEALAIVRWDWIMDDVRPARLATGLAWALTILALNAGLWGLLGRLCRGSAVAGSALFLAAVYGARWLGEDRFYPESLWCIAPALALAAACRPGFGFRERHRLEGLLAIALALPALWGRIPNFTLPLVEQLLFLTPAAVVTCGLGTWNTKLARVGLGLAGVASLGLGSPTGVTNTNEGSSSATVHDSSDGQDTPPNVLFILVDTLRQDHVGGYQGAQDTPSTQRLAAEGVRFADAITVIPKTTQSVAAFQTGNYPVTSGVRILRDVLPAEQHTLAERLREQGYLTGAVVHNGWVMR
ncbi:MAG: sulfatase-like hydrolase/transferase, partial [Myxococcota bacterium]|nr:sulfatase-like hydrolase/transferase [Myxococcota bacterium]